MMDRYYTGMNIDLIYINTIDMTILPDHSYQKQGKSEGFDSCDRHSNLTQIGLKSSNDLEKR